MRPMRPLVVSTLLLAAILLGAGPLRSPLSGVPAAVAATTLKAQFFLPKGHPISKRLEAIYREIEQATDGAVKIQSFYASELVPLPEALDGLSNGTLDILVGPGNYYSGKIALADFGIMPLNFKSYASRSKAFYDKGVGHILDQAYSKLGVTVRAPFDYFIGEVLLVRKGITVNGYADLKGLKVRVAGGELVALVKAMGAEPVFIAPPEVYTGLQRGTVDAAIFPIHDLKPLRLQEVVGTALGPDYLFSGPMMHFFMFNKKTWDGLSAKVRGEIDATLRHAAARDDANAERELDTPYRASAEQAGVKLVDLPPAEIEKAKLAVFDAHDAYLKYNRDQGNEAQARQILEILDRLLGIEG
jgi:TRAP-type C4-dicarboxylate transport system substrate-binding protein